VSAVKADTWIAFIFLAAVKPPVAAAGQTPEASGDWESFQFDAESVFECDVRYATRDSESTSLRLSK
jgi:hypothetical protein